jgi:hypothetical protein
MGATREKGKIPHSEWPKILARYSGGETIAKIGRDYGCTAPAIRYIIKRSGGLIDAAARASGRKSASLPRSAPLLSEAGSRLTATQPGETLPAEQGLSAELRKRVSSDVASFLVALDYAVLNGSIDSIVNLQDATDRLMRSTARTRLELERLVSRRLTEPARDKGRKRPAPRPEHDA